MTQARPIVLFDGECAYCNGWVRWIAERDRKKTFQFVPLISAEGSSLLHQYGVPAAIDSIVLIEKGKAWFRSDAAWRILGALPGHGLNSWLLRLIPRSLRDKGYDLIARNRHRLGAGPLPPL
jgi:predicted DCC family thiol-disulfide oxidoreductase YuxK